MKELVLRFLIGGTLVSVFAFVGDLLRPKSFAGLFRCRAFSGTGEPFPYYCREGQRVCCRRGSVDDCRSDRILRLCIDRKQSYDAS